MRGIVRPRRCDMSGIARATSLYGFALLFALVEIEIEGPHGWAARLPTWCRRRPAYARLYGLFMSGKPLTGYHLFMFALSICAFHLPFALGLQWSAATELRLLATYGAWIVVWDLLWFVLNPAWGWARFRRGAIWWMAGPWAAGLPVEYWKALAASFALAAGVRALEGTWAGLEAHAMTVGAFVALTAAATAGAPAYRRWYAHMRRPGTDQRPPEARKDADPPG